MSNKRPTLTKKTEKCSCKGYNLDKLLQPNILSLLATRDMHGYVVIQELEKLDLFNGEKIDNTGIYRTL
jgi:DNA-binding PadR family transcriptional regulator